MQTNKKSEPNVSSPSPASHMCRKPNEDQGHLNQRPDDDLKMKEIFPKPSDLSSCFISQGIFLCLLEREII